MDGAKTLSNASASVTYTAYGGTVLFLTIRNKSVLFLSPFSRHPELPVRGGIPVIWPWFGKDPRGKHGLARSAQFEIMREEVTSDTVFLEMRLKHEQLVCSLIVEAGYDARITLKTQCEGEFQGFSAALHAYFAVDEDYLCIEGLPNEYLDALDNMQPKCNDGYLFNLYNGLDRIYTSYPACVSINGLKITPFGCDSLVLWNPGAAAREMSDLHSHAGFVCIEPALLNHKTLLYNEEVSFGFKIQLAGE